MVSAINGRCDFSKRAENLTHLQLFKPFPMGHNQVPRDSRTMSGNMTRETSKDYTGHLRFEKGQKSVENSYLDRKIAKRLSLFDIRLPVLIVSLGG